jgi:hypothetical protein
MEAKKVELVNAKYMNEQNPETFEIPSAEELNNLKQGDSIMVCCQRERFWVEIMYETNNKIFVCRIDNDLIFTDEHGLDINDLIYVTRENIYNIYKYETTN